MGRFLVPFLFFALGFFIAWRVLGRAPARGTDAGLEEKYREVCARYRDLTRRLDGAGSASELKAKRLRRTLWDLRGMLAHPESVSAERARTALQEIESALEETA